MWPFNKFSKAPKWHVDYKPSKEHLEASPSSDAIPVPESFCCDRFAEAVSGGEIKFAYASGPEIDETQWYIPGCWHLYFCPFCGANVKGHGFGDYDTTIKSKAF